MMNNNKHSNIKILKTRKYKDISLYLRFSIPANRKNRALAILLSKSITESCKKYPNKNEMLKVKDMLYGISFESRSEYRAGVITVNMDYSFIHPKFISIDVKEYINFINETLYNPLFTSKKLKESKRIILDTIYRRLEKPVSYSIERSNEIISEELDDFRYFTLSKDFVDDINNVTLKELKEFYSYLINKAQLYVYVSGDVDDGIASLLTDFSFKDRIVLKRKKYKKNNKVKEDVSEHIQGKQSTLVSFYKTPYDKYSKEFFAWKLGNLLLGGLPCSLLFEEVREKMSLCYSITSSDYLDEGLVRIITSIDGDKKDVVLNQIDIQINRLINMDYDDSRLSMAKKLFCSSLESIEDSDEEIIGYLYEGSLSGRLIETSLYKKEVNKVTKKDISDVFKKYTHYFTYFLEGLNNE